MKTCLMFYSHYWHLTDLYTRPLDQILFTIKQVISLLEPGMLSKTKFSHGVIWAWPFDHVQVSEKFGSDRKSIIYGSKYRIKPLTEWYINLHGICTN